MYGSGFGSAVARIAALDSRIRQVDPDWKSTDTGAALVGLGSFSSVLTDVSSMSDPSQPASAADATATTDPTLSPYFNTVFSDFYVRARAVNSVGFSSPLPGGRLTQSFGPTSLSIEPAATVGGVHYAHYHNGIDLAAKLGTPILAAASGTVIYAGRMSDGAVVVKIRHDDGYVSLYGHLNPSLDVKVGDKVQRGQRVGLEGMTGNTTGPHVHFALYTKAGKAVDPQPFLDSGKLPEAESLATPSSVSSPGETTWESSQTVLARFDAVASKIPYASQIRSAAIANGIDPLLLAALVSNESSFHANSVSSAGAKGLTQLMPKTASGMGVSDPFNVQQNLDGGAKYLALQVKRFGRIDMALAAYSKGPGTVWRAGGVPSSATGYIRKVLTKWTRYEEAAV